MLRERERGRVRERLERIAGAGLEAEDARREAIAALRRAVGFDRWCWPLTDPASVLATSGVGEIDFWPSLPLLVAFEQHGDVATKPGLALGPRPSCALSAAAGGDLARSARWRECLRPYGIGDELMTLCRDRHGCWGTVELMRDSGDPPFADDETELLAELAPLLGTMLRRSLVETAAQLHDEPRRPLPPATLILDADHRPVSWTASFRDWLAELPADVDALPPAVYELCARLAAPEEVRHELGACVRVRTRAGRWAALEGALLEGGASGQTAIIVRDASLDEIFDMLARTYDFSRRERELVALVLEGYDTKQLADTLCISPHTVQDHLKAVFAKTRVRSRRELASQLSGR